jgi:hypothetical protein
MMRMRLIGTSLLTLLALVLLYLPESRAQQDRNRPSRRITNPARTQPAVPVPTPAPTDAVVVSSADDQSDEERVRPRPTPRRTSRTRRQSDAENENENLRRTVNSLSTQVREIAEDLNELKGQQKTLVDLERLTRAEQRAENFRQQLREVLEKELNLQGRSEQIDYELEPEQIDRRAGMVGTLNPATLREQIRRQLESEKRRVQQQLELLTTSRIRLEGAIISADAEVEKLRARLDEDERQATGTTNERTTSRPSTTETDTQQNQPPDNIPH